MRSPFVLVLAAALLSPAALAAVGLDLQPADPASAPHDLHPGLDLDAALALPPVLDLVREPAPTWQDYASVAETQLFGAPRAPVVLPHPGMPSASLRVLLGAAGAEVPEERLAAYDALPASARDALAMLLEAHLASAALTRAAFAHTPPDVLEGPTDAASLAFDPGPLLVAQRTLLAASQAALPALRGFDPRAAPEPLLVCGAVALDLRDVANTYVCDTPFSLDLAGDDLYLNNAGGNGAALTSVGGVALGTAAFALDLDGDDRYLAQYLRGAAAGGGLGGLGFLVEGGGDDVYDVRVQRAGAANGGGDVGAGALLELGGHDTYYGATGLDPTFHDEGGGINGGSVAALGLHVDLSGNDARDGYCGGSGGVNGGTHGGVGVLLDYAGHDTYDGFVKTLSGVNGGAFSGAALLFDREGNDRYRGVMPTLGGVNGGAMVGAGALVDLAGDDSYDGLAGQGGVNGGSYELQGTGFLYDGGGNDRFVGEITMSGGINGGSFFGDARLINRGGVDVYDTRTTTGGIVGVNGATFFGGALLWDVCGVGDLYRNVVGEPFAVDETIQQNGAVGNQVDSNPPFFCPA